jgi:hypothetical protein
MPSTASDIFDALGGSLSQSASKSVFLELAEDHVPSSIETRRPHLVALYALHQAVLSQGEGAAGAIQSKREGQLGVSFSSNGVGVGLNSTSYGNEYLKLFKALNGGNFLVVEQSNCESC